MTLINLFQLFLEIGGVIFWLCILFCIVWLPFACKNAQEDPDEKIYKNNLDNRNK